MLVDVETVERKMGAGVFTLQAKPLPVMLASHVSTGWKPTALLPIVLGKAVGKGPYLTGLLLLI